ncbi:hypothetical protein Pfo_009780 [Paulownia fortunei]|nr:hypothetical protein Pfo_009780 [Paulownia fortunei]
MARLRVLHFTVFLAMISTLVQTEELMNSRKLDEAPPDFQNKCGSCPCNNPCNPPPSPPPPSPPPPPPPPPPKKTPLSNYCPPPPSGGGGGQYPPNPPYIFINGPPGNLYPVDYSGSGRSFSTGLVPFLISSVVGLIAFW